MGTSFEYSKTLAGEGSILLILSIVPYVGWVLGIIGVILFLKGVKELANYYQDNEIYQNSLTGVKFYIIALIAAAVAITAIVIGVGSATGYKYTAGFTPTVGFGVGVAAFFVGLIVAFIFYVLAASHLRRTFDTLAQKSGEKSFATAATLLWWGSILTIIVVGLVLIFIAWIFAVVGFFSMRSSQQQQYAPQPPGYIAPSSQPVTQAQQSARYCSYCGAPVPPDATYCAHCGKQLTS
ncbi:MAG TPA: DUF996 domain-containing protein [Candidatus Limnocylindrales bacterium]|nr:DUF996 domain-containing protein [Candidatus Limnocylindrales bacterium]